MTYDIHELIIGVKGCIRTTNKQFSIYICHSSPRKNRWLWELRKLDCVFHNNQALIQDYVLQIEKNYEDIKN